MIGWTLLKLKFVFFDLFPDLKYPDFVILFVFPLLVFFNSNDYLEFLKQ